jgi:hypothetical protein
VSGGHILTEQLHAGIRRTANQDSIAGELRIVPFDLAIGIRS